MSTISLFENGRGQGLSILNLFELLEAVKIKVDVSALVPEVSRTDLAKMWREANS